MNRDIDSATVLSGRRKVECRRYENYIHWNSWYKLDLFQANDKKSELQTVHHLRQNSAD